MFWPADARFLSAVHPALSNWCLIAALTGLTTRSPRHVGVAFKQSRSDTANHFEFARSRRSPRQISTAKEKDDADIGDPFTEVSLDGNKALGF
jgi:hypothetical protein